MEQSAQTVSAKTLTPREIAEISHRYGRELVGIKDGMFVFLMLWTGVLLGMQWANFFFNRAVPISIQEGYAVLLGAYIAHKEVLRWTGIIARIRRGELFVYIWWGTLLLMYIAEYVWAGAHVADGTRHLAYAVLFYFILSEVSKSLNTRKRGPGNGTASV